MRLHDTDETEDFAPARGMAQLSVAEDLSEEPATVLYSSAQMADLLDEPSNYELVGDEGSLSTPLPAHRDDPEPERPRATRLSRASLIRRSEADEVEEDAPRRSLWWFAAGACLLAAGVALMGIV